MANTQNVSQNGQLQRKADFKAMLDNPQFQAKFVQALGKNANQFIASLSEIYGSDEQLAKCDKNKIALEALKAATLHLPINKNLGYSYLLVFNNNVKQSDGSWAKVPTPTMVIGYKGYIQLAQRTGQYKFLNADVVYEGEIYHTNKLTGEIEIKSENKISNKIVGYFAHFELLNGFCKTYYMTFEQMTEYALRYSPSFKSKNPPTKGELMEKAQQQEDTNSVGNGQGWTSDFRSMALKVCLSQLLRKYGYLSVEMQEAFTKEDEGINRDEEIANNANTTDIEDVEAEVVAEQGKEQGGERPKPF